MTDNQKSWTSALVVIACIALLGFLVHEKVDGASVAAVAIVTTLIGYFARPPDKKDPPGGAAVIAGILAVAALQGCAPGKAPDVRRETARAAVVTLADAASKLDAACAAYVRASGDADVGRRCVEAYTIARTSLVAVASAVDAWDRADHESATCAVLSVTAALLPVARELVARQVDGLEVVDDAVTLARALGPCRGGS